MTDWSAKTPLQWDWENTIMFNARAAQYPKSTDWEIDVDTGSLYSSGVGCAGGLDLGHVTSSSKSSVDSSSLEKTTSNFHFEEFEEFNGHLSFKKEPGNVNQTGSSVTLETLMGNGEPFIGLKLGKRTYFEDFCIGSNEKASHNSVNITSSTPTEKRLSCQRIRCQVEGCNLDLSSAKEYHRKHKVCEIHSKFPKVIIKGLERRFCQQCSRFQSLSDFDGEKRSCRKRLSNHNSRRRKPKNETILFNSARLGSILYDGGQQMEFNKFPFVHSSSDANLTLESMCNQEFTLMNESPLRPQKPKGSDGKMHLLSREPSNAMSMFYHDSKWPLPSKGGTTEILNDDLEESMISSNSDAAHDVNRALSLLSTTSWDSCEPEAASVNRRRDLTSTEMPHSLINTMSEGLPFSASENWRTEQSPELLMHSFNGHNNCHLSEFQLFNFPYGSGI